MLWPSVKLVIIWNQAVLRNCDKGKKEFVCEKGGWQNRSLEVLKIIINEKSTLNTMQTDEIKFITLIKQ